MRANHFGSEFQEPGITNSSSSASVKINGLWVVHTHTALAWICRQAVIARDRD
jgi:hypothetical protein